MKQLSKTLILTRHHLTPLANIDVRGSEVQYEVPQEVISRGRQPLDYIFLVVFFGRRLSCYIPMCFLGNHCSTIPT